MPAAWISAGAAVIGVASSMGSGGDVSGSAAASAADPFASQREQYQGLLQGLMTNGGGAAGQAATNNLSQMNSMLQPGNSFTSNDPSYQFRLQQGTENVNRGAAKSGLLDSGNRLTALQDYGQGTASAEYNAQFSRLQSAAVTDQNFQTNNYQQLAQLSGANSGQPGQAGSILQTQAAQSAAGFQSLANNPTIQNGISSLWNSATGNVSNNIWGDATYTGGSTGSSNGVSGTANQSDGGGVW